MKLPPRTFMQKLRGVYEQLELSSRMFIQKLRGVSPRTFMQKLGRVYEPLQLATFLHESQNPSLLDLLPEEIDSSEVFPTEVMALSWILEQPECCVTKLR